MRKLIFTNAKGESIKIGEDGLFLLTSVSGLSDLPEEEDNRRSPGQDGETFVNSVFGPREPLIEGAINSVNNLTIYSARREMARVLNPKLGLGSVMYYTDYATHELVNVKPTLPKFPERGQNVEQRFLFELIGKDPYWYTPSFKNEELSGWEGGLEFNDAAGGLEFPISGGVETGIQMETMAATASVIVRNNGDIPTPIEAWFKGPLTQAKLTNETTGEYILIDHAIAADEELYVSTKMGELDVIIKNVGTGVETDAWGYLGEENTFIQLEPGDNELSYDTTGAGVGTSVRVRFRDRIVGF